MEKLKSKIVVRFARNEKDFCKLISKPRYISQKIFANNLVAICKNKVALALRKSAYVRICKLDLNKVLIFELH